MTYLMKTQVQLFPEAPNEIPPHYLLTIPEDGIPSESSDWLIRQTGGHAVQHTPAPDESGGQQSLPQATPRRKHHQHGGVNNLMNSQIMLFVKIENL